MKKPLCEMSLEELWQLFPIVLTPHDPRWVERAAVEISRLETLLSEYAPVISHIGSTAIPDIQAKPIVDILVEVSAAVSLDEMKETLTRAGYICMALSADRLSLNKGYTPEGYADEVFHIHIHRLGDNAEIAFRDYLRAHPAAAREYEKLKLSLLPTFRNDRDAYTEAKSEFVRRIVSLARRRPQGKEPAG